MIESLGFEVLDNSDTESINIETSDIKSSESENGNILNSSNKNDEYYLKDLKDKRTKIIVGFTISGIIIVLILIPGAHHFAMTISNTISISMAAMFLIISIIPFIYVSGPIIKSWYNSLSYKNVDMEVMYSMGILVAFIASLIGTFNIILDSSFMFYKIAIILAAFLNLGRYLEAKAKKRTSNSIKSLIGMWPKVATLLTPNIPNSNTNNDSNSDSGSFTEKTILIEDIKIGNLLIVKPGEKIPTDREVFDGKSYIDESMITDELMPEEKRKNATVYAGTINKDGVLKIKATKVGKDTILSQIIELVDKAQGSKPPVQKIANRVVTYFIPTIIIIAITSFYFG